MTSQTLPLNLIPKGVCPRLYVSQYDKGQEWNFDIYAGTEAYTIPSGSTVTIQGTKPDKTGFQYACSFSGNRVTATEQQQMTIIAGDVPAEIRIEKNNEIIATLNFIIAVEKAALADDTVISETDLPLIEEAIEVLGHADELVNQIQGYATTAQNAASTATTKASQASTSATNASNSATTASNAATTATNKASEATSAASTATTKAGEASTSATSAAGSASTATTKAQEAAASAAAAAQSAAHLTIDSTMSITSENALQNKVVTSAIQNLSNYCANNGVKNVLDINIEALQSISDNIYSAATFTLNSFIAFGITWTINPDGSVKMSGTNNSSNARNLNIWKQNGASTLKKGQYIMSVRGVDSNAYVVFGGSSGTSTQTIKTDTDITIDVPSDYASFKYLLIQVAGNASPTNTIKIMIRDASISDSTMQGNSHTNAVLTQKADGLTNNNATINLAPNTATLGAQENRGVTYTVYPNGTVNVNGTANADWSYLAIFRDLKLKAGTYVLSGIPEGNGDKGKLRFDISGTGVASGSYVNGSHEFTVTSDNSSVTVQITVRTSGVTINNQLVKPMITTLEDYGTYERYVPYNGKTNKELTEDVAKLTIKTATFSANTGANGIVASGIPEAKAPKCIPISVSFTSTSPPPCVGFEYNNSYGAWYIRCKSWDGSLKLNADVAGTISYIDLN